MFILAIKNIFYKDIAYFKLIINFANLKSNADLKKFFVKAK